MTLAPPKKLKVGSSVFSVDVVEQYPPDCDDNAYGLCDTVNERIYMKREQSDGQLKDTMLHEALHAIRSRAAISISDESEERLIQQFAPWLLMLIQDNPKLVAYLAEKVT